MNNLSKYELLKHRHLSLLLELEAAGIAAKYDGKWTVTKPARHHPMSIGYYPPCETCGSEGWVATWCNGKLSALPCPAVGCAWRPRIPEEICDEFKVPRIYWNHRYPNQPDSTKCNVNDHMNRARLKVFEQCYTIKVMVDGEDVRASFTDKFGHCVIMNLKNSGSVRSLLAELKAAILAPSPAKVD